MLPDIHTLKKNVPLGTMFKFTARADTYSKNEVTRYGIILDVVQAEQILYATMGTLTESGEFYLETLVWDPERRYHRIAAGARFDNNVILDANNKRMWTYWLNMAAQPIEKLQRELYLYQLNPNPQNSRAFLDDVLRTHGNDAS